ncbi:MAG: (d)CMP kinase [Actinobacteria bacterium]|nr:(d)CMP kinase [Actinomycetota bacterium]
MIIAIDGPAGSGKSTIAQAVAERLALTYVDTGAMYRAVTLLALEKGVSLEDDDALGSLALEMEIDLSESAQGLPQVRVAGRDVTKAIREPLVSQKVSYVAAHRKVREALKLRQRGMAETGDVVLEGRDIGTVVCPRADLKVFLTASVGVRAVRRKRQLEEQGICISAKTLEREILLRDTHDSTRSVAPLRKPRDAIEIDTTELSIEEVVDRIAAEAVGVGSDGGGSC